LLGHHDMENRESSGAGELFHRVRLLELKTRGLVEGVISGAYYSAFKGRGIEFSEVREYQRGDDPRCIDWNVTARMSRPYVKEFIEERDLTVLVLLDVSGSTGFGSLTAKRDVGIELAASIAFSAQKNNDRVGLLLATDRVERFVPPRKGSRHILRLIREMLHCNPRDRGTNLEGPLTYLSRVIRKKSIIFLVSDFQQDLHQFERPIQVLRNRHDVVAVRIRDPREEELPDIGLVVVEDGETGEQMLVDTSDPRVQASYRKRAEEERARVRGFFRRLKIDFLDISTQEGWHRELLRFLARRSSQR